MNKNKLTLPSGEALKWDGLQVIGWMDGWMDDGWMNRWMDEWMNGWMDEWIAGWMDSWMDGWMKKTKRDNKLIYS